MTRNVLQIIPYLAEAAGGPPVVVRRLMSTSCEAGWHNEAWTCPDYSQDGGRELEGQANVTVLPSQFAPLRGAWRSQLKQAMTTADIVHCHTIWSPLVTICASIARERGVPYILAPHGMLDPYSFRQKQLKKRLYLEAFERRTISRAAKVLFTTIEEKELAESTFGPISSAVVVPLGADRLPENRQVLRDRFFDQHRDLRGRPLLLFMGRLHPKKRPEILPDVMSAIQSNFPQATLIFVGTGEASFVELVKRRAHNLALGDRVRFLGHLSGEAKFCALAAADLFILPSHQENFGIAVAEAMQAGVPVVLTRNVNIWREIEKAKAGVAVTEDDLIYKLASAVTALLSDDKRRAIMSHNAQKLASEAFSWDASCKRTLEIYEDVLAQT
jgi:glycosyltransferase involved in cell wall biosynthesis